MAWNRFWGVLAAIGAVCVPVVLADEVRNVKENGVTYAETVRTVRRPVTETSIEEKEVTVYRPQCRTEMEEHQQTAFVPVTEYHWEAYWVGRWNPFRQPYMAQRLAPRTRWEPRTEVVQVPVVRRELIAEKRVQQVPHYSRRFVEEEVVTRRVAVSAPRRADPFADGQLAQGQRIGGVSKLESDPPRQGSETAWRPARVTKRR